MGGHGPETREVGGDAEAGSAVRGDGGVNPALRIFAETWRICPPARNQGEAAARSPIRPSHQRCADDTSARLGRDGAARGREYAQAACVKARVDLGCIKLLRLPRLWISYGVKS